MKLPALLQLRVLKLALASLFGRPYTSLFPKGKYEPIASFRGRPRYHEEDCIDCGACAEVCPAIAIEVFDNPDPAEPARTLVQHLDVCIQCGMCEKYCTTEKGITLTTEWDYVGFKREDFEERVSKELVLCEVCGEIIAPLDQLRWLTRRLGPMAYCNPTLMLVSQKELTVVDPGLEMDTEHPERARRINIQCPRCRRTTALSV